MNKPLTKEINTKRLSLRKMAEADAASLLKVWSDPEVTRFMDMDSFQEEAQAKEMITLLTQLSEENKAIRYSIIKVGESHEIIGSCGYNFIDFDNEKAEIGYDIGRVFWGKGYATEAVSALVEHAFTHLKLNRIEAKVDPDNVNSKKVLEKLNFTLEGTLRQYERVNDGFRDVSIYSKLSSDK